MRIGISISSVYPDASNSDAASFAIERAQAAASAGLASLTIGDHHATGPVPYVANVPMLGRLLAEWDDRPAGLLFLVPAWSPVLMAEQIGTLAAIAEGPFVVQTGLGSKRQAEVMGLEVAHLGNRLERTIQIVQALLAGERVTDPDFGLVDVAVAPTPPRSVEWWIGASADIALDRAARLGDAWYGDAGGVINQAVTERSVYLEACERYGRGPGRSLLRKDVFVSDNDAHGVEVGRRLIDAGYRGGRPAEAVAFGGIDRVVEQLAPFAEAGFDDVIIRTMSGVSQAEAIRSIELTGQVAAQLT